MKKFWLRERGKEPPVYCPAKLNANYEVMGVVTGMNLIGKPKNIIGQFWHDDNNELHVLLKQTIKK